MWLQCSWLCSRASVCLCVCVRSICHLPIYVETIAGSRSCLICVFLVSIDIWTKTNGEKEMTAVKTRTHFRIIYQINSPLWLDSMLCSRFFTLLFLSPVRFMPYLKCSIHHIPLQPMLICHSNREHASSYYVVGKWACFLRRISRSAVSQGAMNPFPFYTSAAYTHIRIRFISACCL